MSLPESMSAWISFIANANLERFSLRERLQKDQLLALGDLIGLCLFLSGLLIRVLPLFFDIEEQQSLESKLIWQVITWLYFVGDSEDSAVSTWRLITKLLVKTFGLLGLRHSNPSSLIDGEIQVIFGSLYKVKGLSFLV